MTQPDTDREADRDASVAGPDAALHEPASGADVHAIFSERLGVRVPDDDTDVIASGLLDSLGVAELLLTLEERFGIAFDMATMSLDDVRSVRAIVGFVDATRAQRPD